MQLHAKLLHSRQVQLFFNILQRLNNATTFSTQDCLSTTGTGHFEIHEE
jgi:hypothetical protein